MNIRKLTCLFLTVAALSVLGRPAFGQVSISGSTCNVAGGSSGYQYSISGSWQVTDNVTWTITGGVIAGTSNTSKSGTIGSIGPSIRVVWNANPTSPHISLYESRLGSTSLYVTVITIPATVSPSTLVVNYGSSVTLTGGAPGSGCSPAYSFWWETAANSSGPFSTVMNAAGQNLTINPFTQKAYYRRALSFIGDVVYSNIALIDIAPFNAGSISASITSLNYNSQPAISQIPASGGNCSSPLYEWQQSIDGGPWKPVGSTAAYPSAAPAVIGSTLIRRKIMCGDQIAFSNILSFTVNYTSANAENLNYIRTNQVVMPGVMSWEQADQLTSSQTGQSTVYFDGLGREIQSVHKQASPLNKDLVQLVVYDNFGREINKYLPYVSAAGDGKFKSDPLAEQNSFNSTQFPGEQYYYGKIDYEPSPLNRVEKTYAPGLNWVGANRGVGTQYLINQASDSVRIWNIAAAPGSIPTTTAIYDAGTLYKNQTTDEQNHTVVEYKDLQGKVILKKVQLADSPGSAHMGWLCTYYIYDDLDNLRFVIQPKAIDLLEYNATWDLNSVADLTSELCFRYEYDARNRMIIKKVPGAGEVWMVYDARDRLVMTQDANMRAGHQWNYTQYDALNRPVVTGLWTDPVNYSNLGYHLQQASTSIAYPDLSGQTITVLTRNFYDDYTWVPTYGYLISGTRNVSNDSHLITPSASFPFPQAATQSFQTRGLPTGTWVNILTTPYGIGTTNIYDDRGRVIQTQSNNIGGDMDVLSTQYSFNGLPLIEFDHIGIPPGKLIVTKKEYDYNGRLTKVWKSIDNAPSDQLIVTNSYNELGQLQNKELGNNLDNLAYDYNIRGWLSTINKNYISGASSANYFGMELGYDKRTSAAGTTYAAAQYNGNITGTVWKTASDGIGRKYDFTYDNVNRLTGADFNQDAGAGYNKSAGLDFSAGNLTYDGNGNILSLNREGFKIGSSSLIDQLSYTYQAASNKLQQVTDGDNDKDTKLGDFHYDPATKTGTDFSYDGNGNLIQDNNKGISSITYNYLNLPEQIEITGKGTITYTYDAAGRKLEKLTVDNTLTPSKTTLTFYMGPCVYQNDTLQFIAHEEGRARWAYHKYAAGTSAYGFEYDFFERDHLGNTRVVLTQQKDTAIYLASMESALRSTEIKLFSGVDNTGYARASVPGYPNDVTFTTPNDSVSRLNGNGPKMGPALLLKVMSGDKLDFSVQSYYNGTGAADAPSSSLDDILNSLATGISKLSAGGKGTVAQLADQTSGPLYAALTSFRADKISTPSGKPKAYLNWILLDEQLKYVGGSGSVQSGAIPVGAASTLNTLGYTGLPITKSGYLYIWVSNETPNWDVFFDNLAVKHYTGPMLEETHYYPFGLTMAGISSKALKPFYAENKYKYNKGSELQNKEFSDGSGLELYSTFYRSLDPQLGRFWQIDPKPNPDFSPYAAMQDNPISFNDVLGDSIIGKANNATADRIVKKATEQMTKNTNTVNSNNKKIDAAKATIAAGATGKDLKKANRTINGLNKKNDELQNRNDKLNTGINAISEMKADVDHNYSFTSPANDDGTHHVTQGEGKNVLIEGSNDGLFLHESTHVLQGLNSGGLKFSTNEATKGLLLNSASTGTHIGDEVQAYLVQFSFDGTFSNSSANNTSDINPASVRSLHEGDYYPYQGL